MARHAKICIVVLLGKAIDKCSSCFRESKGGEQTVQAQQVEATASTCAYCHFDAYTECELGLESPDSKLCAKCVANCYDEIIRTR